jgi:hypothetical protein
MTRRLFLLTLLLLSTCIAAGPAPGFAGTYAIARPASQDLAPRKAAAAGTNLFEGFVRYPAEQLVFLGMTAKTAYYRDVFVGGETFSDQPSEGDSISAQMFDANNALIATWDPYVFHTSFNGQQNCWVSTFNGYICDISGIDVTWYRTSQCTATGNYTMKFLRNNVEFAADTFVLKPQISPDALPAAYNQGSYTDAYDDWCYSVNATGGRIAGSNHTCHNPLLANEKEYTIKQKGCYLSDAAGVLNYHGVAATDPPTLNDALNAVAGGYSAGNVNPRAVADQGTAAGVNMRFVGATNDLYNAICQYGPTLVGVHCNASNQAGHWVLAYGRDANKTTWLILDPNGGHDTTLAVGYSNKYCAARVFSGPEHTFTTSSGITIKFHSPVELLLTDPQGRRLGTDPVTGQSFDEIPGAYYEAGGLEDDETGEPDDDPAKTLFLPTPAVGDYALAVTGTANGTYNSELVFYDVNGAASESDLRNIPVSLNQVQRLTFSYSDTAGASTQVAGGFDGGGQRPRDVNRFLSYGNPSGSPVSLAAGTQSFSLLVFYGATTIPSSFSATLAGVDVTSLFHPQPGQAEMVVLPLVSGRNVLQLSIQGNLSSRIATDSDRLVFQVP